LLLASVFFLTACDEGGLAESSIFDFGSRGATVEPVALADASVAPGKIFPAFLETTPRGCGFPAIKNPSLLDENSSNWYTSHLKAADERPLPQLAAAGPEQLHVRFLWLRSFDHPMVVRIDEQANGGAVIEAKRLSGAGGYEPGEIAELMNRELTRMEFREFKAVFGRSRLAEEPTANCDMGADGAQWILEVVADGKYAFYERWTPEDEAVRDVALRMLTLTGWDLEPLY
tara:strand:+ start:731 stop:1420 length:690 start_codon:yes stop_codon:yes gene_type:complete